MSLITLKGGDTYNNAQEVENHLLPREGFHNYPFVFVHYAMGWSFDDESGRLLPELSTIVGRPAVNGVGDDGKMSAALGRGMEKGGIIIQPKDPRLGPWTGYVQRRPVRGGGWHYFFMGTEFTLLPGGKAKSVDNGPAFKAFRIHLLDASIVGPIHKVAFDVLMDIEKRGYDRIVKASTKLASTYAEAQMAAKVARMEAMRRAFNGPDDAVGVRTSGGEAIDPTAGVDLTPKPKRGDKIALGVSA